MGPLVIAYHIISGMCLTMGVLHWVIFLRSTERKVDLFFAVMALGVGLSAFFETRFYGAAGLDDAISAFKYMLTFQGITWVAFVWFIALYTGTTRRSLTVAVTAVYTLAIIVNIASTNSIIYASVDTLHTTELPWGERIAYISGEPNSWRYLADIAWLIFIYLAAESCFRLWKKGERGRALLFGIGLLTFLGIGYLHDTLLDLRVADPPYIFCFTFLALILVMSAALINEVVRASILSREVAVAEERWRSLMENVKLLVFGVDPNERINYVNPHFCAVSGYNPSEILNKPFVELFPDGDWEELRGRFKAAMAGDIRPIVTRPLLTKDNRLRTINWFIVINRDSNNQISGTLSVGEDVTEFQNALRALVDEKSRMDIILSSLNTGLALINADMTVAWVNQKTQEILPWEELVGKVCYEAAAKRDQPCEGCGALQTFSDGQIHETERQSPVDGKWHHIVSLPIKDDSGKVVQVLEATTDITARKQAEQSRDRYLKELEALKAQLEEENVYLKEEIESKHGFKEIIGRSNTILYVLEKVRQVAETDATVLIQGETGVGKELIARAIHGSGKRAKKPFVKVNCAALPANLVETELFGHEAGAFTGAVRLRKGRFELADGGTILLDEISEMPSDVQAKLLRVLQEGQFERIGSSRSLTANVRVIAATNRNLTEEVAAGRFRPDLFYRLNVYPLTVPPLRNRRDDIPLLVNHFVPQMAVRIGKHVDQIPPNVLDKLIAYDWPGNVRELINILERAVITSPDAVIRLPEEIAEPSKQVKKAGNPRTQLVDLQTVQREHILSVLNAVNWRISGPKGAAKILGLNPSTLRFRMQKLGIMKNN